MTTTGGPEHSLAYPANEHEDDPIVVERDSGRASGDDIVVEPAAAGSHPRRRARALLVGSVVVALAGAAIGVALATRSSTGKQAGASNLRSAQPVRPPAARPAVRKNAIAAKPGRRLHPVPTPTAVTPAPPVPVAPPAPPASVVSPLVSTPAVATPPAPAPTLPPTPPSEPPSVLQWKATPAALSVKAGAPVSFTVNVLNPTNGTVTLPLPLSCAPTLRGPHGAVFGSTVCEQLAQVMSRHQHLTRRYTIYATTTADPSGSALAPGNYTVSVEGLFTVNVTVTAS